MHHHRRPVYTVQPLNRTASAEAQPRGHCHANEDLPPLGDVVDGGSFHLDIEKRPFSNTTLAAAAAAAVTA